MEDSSSISHILAEGVPHRQEQIRGTPFSKELSRESKPPPPPATVPCRPGKVLLSPPMIPCTGGEEATVSSYLEGVSQELWGQGKAGQPHSSVKDQRAMMLR